MFAQEEDRWSNSAVYEGRGTSGQAGFPETNLYIYNKCNQMYTVSFWLTSDYND